MVNFLILGRVLKLFRFTHAGPQYIPLARRWWNDPNTCCLHCVDHRVIDVCAIVDLDPQGHVLVHHLVLMDSFNLHKRVLTLAEF